METQAVRRIGSFAPIACCGGPATFGLAAGSGDIALQQSGARNARRRTARGSCLWLSFVSLLPRQLGPHAAALLESGTPRAIFMIPVCVGLLTGAFSISRGAAQDLAPVLPLPQLSPNATTIAPMRAPARV